MRHNSSVELQRSIAVYLTRKNVYQVSYILHVCGSYNVWLALDKKVAVPASSRVLSSVRLAYHAVNTDTLSYIVHGMARVRFYSKSCDKLLEI